MKNHKGSEYIAIVLNFIAVIAIAGGLICAAQSLTWLVYGILSGISFFVMAAVINILITISRTVQRREERERRQAKNKEDDLDGLKEIFEQTNQIKSV